MRFASRLAAGTNQEGIGNGARRWGYKRAQQPLVHQAKDFLIVLKTGRRRNVLHNGTWQNYAYEPDFFQGAEGLLQEFFSQAIRLAGAEGQYRLFIKEASTERRLRAIYGLRSLACASRIFYIFIGDFGLVRLTGPPAMQKKTGPGPVPL